MAYGVQMQLRWHESELMEIKQIARRCGEPRASTFIKMVVRKALKLKQPEINLPFDVVPQSESPKAAGSVLI